MPTKKITETITPESILSPKPQILEVKEVASEPVVINSETFRIFPMEDRVLMEITNSISEIISLIDTVVHFSAPEEERPIINAATIIPILPKLISILLPNSTKLIAAAIRKDEQWIQDNMNLAKRLEALRLIIVAENIPLILGNWQALVEALTPVQITN